jgi:hypothetical protein
MRGFCALNFSQPLGRQVWGAWGPSVETLAGFPIRNQIFPELAESFLPVGLVQRQKVRPVAFRQGGTFGAVPKVAELALLKADSLSQLFAGIGGKLFPLALCCPLAPTHWDTSRIQAAH